MPNALCLNRCTVEYMEYVTFNYFICQGVEKTNF